MGVYNYNIYGEDPQYETVNPLKPGTVRADSNVSTMRNFLIESDELVTERPGTAEEAKEVIRKHLEAYGYAMLKAGIVSRVVYSGNKSLHFIITIDYEPESKEEYKYIFNRLADKLESEYNIKVDRSCGNPSRLTRKPDSVNTATGFLQKCLYRSENVFRCTNWHYCFYGEKEEAENARKYEEMIRANKSKQFVNVNQDKALKTNRKNVDDFLTALRCCPDGDRHNWIRQNIGRYLPQMKNLHQKGMFSWKEFLDAAGTKDSFNQYRKIVES